MMIDPSGYLGELGILGGLLGINPQVLIAVAILLLLIAVIITIANATETEYTRKQSKAEYYVYTLSDEQGVFYVGITKNLKQREEQHKKKYGNDIWMIHSPHPMNIAKSRVYETGLIIKMELIEKFNNETRLGNGIPGNQRLSISSRRYPGSLLVNKAESELLLMWEMLGGQ